MERFQHDLIYGWRRLRRTPGFTLVAVLTLAFGIGANTALFSLVNGLLLKPIPVSNLHRLAALTKEATSLRGFSLSEDEYQSLVESQLPAIEQVFVSNPVVGALSGAGQTDVVTGELVSGAYFDALGVVPRAGRLLQPPDDLAADAGTPVVISERLWQRWFASDPSAIGQVVKMAGYSMTIVGVAPDVFRGTWLPTMLAADLWIPVTATSHVRTVQALGPQPDSHRPSGRTFVLLRPGVTLPQASAAVAGIRRGAQSDTPLRAVPAERAIVFDEFAKPGLMLGSAVLAISSLVFLIACANMTNLLLARGAARNREVAIRLATGASRGRIFRLILTEICLLVVLAGVGGLGIAFASTRLMTMIRLPEVQGMVFRFDPSPDLRVFAYAFGVAVLSALAVGIVPAWRAAGTEPLRVLASTGAGLFSTARGHRLRTWLVASQVAMSMVLLLGAGLYTHSAFKSLQLNPGYEVANRAMASVDLRMHNYDEPRGRRVLERLLEAARQMPGVQTAALTSGLPAALSESAVILAEGQSPRAGGHIGFSYLRVSQEFFQAVGIPLRRGRTFTEADGAGAPRVAVVSERMGAMIWPGQDPIGRRLSIQKNGPLFEVVGIVKDTATDLSGRRSSPFLYVRFEQNYSGRMSVIVKAGSEARAILEPLRQALQAVDRDVAIFDVRTVADTLGIRLTPIRITALVLGLLGALGLGIAMLGLYGVISYLVTERTREFGIRKALGASGRQVYSAVFRESASMLALGVVPGLILASIGAGYLRHLLYGIEPHDPLTFVGVPLVLVLVGLAASYVPARRAAHVEPSVALRDL